MTVIDTPTPKPRGFAAWDRQKLRDTAQKGGKAAHAMGVAHRFSKEEARVYGSMGGRAMHAKRKAQEP